MGRSLQRLKHSRQYLPFLLHSYHLKLSFANAVCGLLPDFVSGSIRSQLYRMAGFEIGPAAFIMGNLELIGNRPGFYSNLTVGGEASIGNHVTINLDAPVRLGTKASIGPYVRIYTGTHQVGPGSQRRMGQVIGRSVTIEEGAWIGLGAIILPGVTVGHGSIVAAGAVVADEVPPNSFVEGNPARVVRQLPWGDR